MPAPCCDLQHRCVLGACAQRGPTQPLRLRLASTLCARRRQMQLRGIGPEFRIVVNVQNVGRHTVMDAMATLAFDHGVYACGQPLARLPALLPGLTRTVHFPLHCVDPNGAAADVRIVVHEGAHTCVPLLTAIVTMPLSEPGLE